MSQMGADKPVAGAGAGGDGGSRRSGEAAVYVPERGDVPPQESVLSAGNRVGRMAWGVVWAVLFRPSPSFLHAWRRMLLRAFGGKIAGTAHVYPSVRVWAPWNLEMGEFACLGHRVEVYSVARVRIGARTTVSQFAHLCAATHDYTKRNYPLLAAPITIGSDCWIATDVFVGPGVTIGEGTVVGARSSVFTDLAGWVVAVGSPAKAVKAREFEGRVGA